MKKFLTFSLFTLLLVIACTAILEYLYRDYLTPADMTFARFYKKQATAETLYIGNSHIGAFNYVINDSTLNIANMSIGGQDIFRMYTVINELIPKCPKIKRVVMNVDYDLLGYNQTLSGQEYIDRQYFPYVHTLYHKTYANYLMSYSSFFRSNRDLAYMFQKHHKSSVADAFIPVAGGGDKSNDADCDKRAKEHSRLKFHKSFINENLLYLGIIDSVCQAHHVRLLLITTPKTKCYKSHSDQANISLAKSKFDSLIVARKILYKDFYNDADFEDDYFVDFDHLNKKGVRTIMAKIDSI